MRDRDGARPIPRSAKQRGDDNGRVYAQYEGEAGASAATELFLLDSVEEGKWDVKSLVRLSPVHEIDVVRALVRLKSGRHIELREQPQEATADEASKDELQDMFRDIDAAATVEASIDNVLS